MRMQASIRSMWREIDWYQPTHRDEAAMNGARFFGTVSSVFD